MKKTLLLIKSKLVKNDGTLNGKIVSALIALAIVFIQQLFACFGMHLKADVTSWVGLINTLLTVLGLIGVLSDPTPVELPGNKTKEK